MSISTSLAGARSIFPRSSSSTLTASQDENAFGSDFPLIQPDRWIKDFREAGFNPEVHDLILKRNAVRVLKLDVAA